MATPERPSFSMSLAMAGLGLGALVPPGPIICEGWMLKKRRKKMQGFARRYFKLYQSGLLEYSFDPEKAARDQMYLTQAAITTTPGHKDIHLDGSTAMFHVKCLTGEDFEKWMAALRSFRATDEKGVPRKSMSSRTLPRLYGQVNKTLEEMGSTLSELEDAFQSLPQDESKRKHHLSWKDKHKEGGKESGSKFHLFKKVNHHDAASESTLSSPPSEHSFISPHHRLQTALDALKSQHSALVQSLVHIPLSDTASGPPTGRHLSSTPESPADSYSRRTSIASGGSVWYDAPEPDGALEFVLENTTQNASGSQFAGGSVHTQEPDEMSDEGEDTDDEGSSKADESEPAAAVTDSKAERATTPNGKEHQQVVRRTQLPSGPVADEGSLFSVLKKNVGKDLSQVAMPVTFNEPLTMLERAAEELEYFTLLDQAAQSTDPVERMCYVAAFAMSAYACTKNRSGRKSFNPMLGETFEDARMNFIAEKVCHQPLVIAYHAQGVAWELTATSSGKTKFWGKSLEIIPLGTNHVKIGDDHFEWKKPSSFMRNLMMGTKYLEHCGEMVIENRTTSARCTLEFKETGYWSPPNIVAGTVYSSTGKPETALEGKWDEQLSRKLDDDHLRVLWRIAAFPKNSRELYGFTAFGITLNEITPDIESKLPPTDSRFRPDVRALEEGDLERAEEEKKRVEEMQRERRGQGKTVEPRWFKEVGKEDWEYVGGYWEERDKGWKDVEPLW